MPKTDTEKRIPVYVLLPESAIAEVCKLTHCDMAATACRIAVLTFNEEHRCK